MKLPRSNRVQAHNLAYVIYTSGSTGQPKGVAITHHSVVTLLAWARKVYARHDVTAVLASTSICFDLSVYELFFPLTWGGKVVLVENALRLLSEPQPAGLTLINTVPSALAELLRRDCIPDTVRVINVAGEVLPRELVEQAYQQSQITRLFNLYGPSEDTTYSTYALIGAASVEAPSIGRPIANTQAYILDEYLNPAPYGARGEIYLGGDGLARGYLHRADLTAEHFIPDHLSQRMGARLYKTGDIARYRANGEIEFLGRSDSQIKLHGYRIETGEIATTLTMHPLVSKAVVLVNEERSGEKRLIAYLESGNALTADELRRFVGERLPAYMVPAAFVVLLAFPLSPNGKIDRSALPRPEFGAPVADVIAPRSATETALARIWSEVLGIEQQHIGVQQDFFTLGGHSLLAVQVQARIQHVLQCTVTLQMLFELPTIARLASWIDQTEQPLISPFPELRPRSATSRQPLPLSFSQQRLWLLDQLQPGNTAYNMPGIVRLAGNLKRTALEQSINAVLARHESLRTTFKVVDGLPVQVILSQLAITIPVRDLRQYSMQQREELVRQHAYEAAHYVFDLAHGPLIYAEMLQLQDEEHILLLTMHHSIADGWSLSILVKEVSTYYSAYVEGKSAVLPDLRVQYADYAIWQRSWLQGEALEQQRTYWKQQLGGQLSRLELPQDGQHEDAQNFQGGLQALQLTGELTEALKRLSQHEGATLYMTMLAAFQLLLYRLTDQTDIIVGSPVSGRNVPELEALIGCFVNTLVLRTDLSGNPDFYQLLQRVRRIVLEAQDHQDLPFEKILEDLQPGRYLGHSPLFDVMLNFNNTPTVALKLADLDLQLLNVLEPESKFALTLYVEERAAGLYLQLVYQRNLFSDARIMSMLDQFQQILLQLVRTPDRCIDEYSLLTPAAQNILPDPACVLNDEHYRLVPQLFEQQVTNHPDQPALNWNGRECSYRQLWQSANSVGNALLGQGLKRGEVVAIAGHISPGVIASILGVLQCGGVLLLIDPHVPEQRQHRLYEEARVSYRIVVAESAKGVLPGESLPTLCVAPADGLPMHVAAMKTPLLVDQPAPDEAAYIFFTSGTTGIPKGILGTHKGLAHFLTWQRETFSIDQKDRAAQLTRLSFDVVLRDILTPLVSGATLCIPEENDILQPEKIISWLNRERITLLHTVPTLAQTWLNALPQATPLSYLRLAFIAGEPLKGTLIRRWRQTFGDAGQLINLYGPTETTLAKCYYPVPAMVRPGVQPVGQALPATQAIVLRARDQRCGVGEAGEIVIRTPYRTLGYINAASAGSERFRPNPFRQDEQDLLYYTGDRGRYLPDGTLEILGRIDDQVKMRGIRIELSEIESILLEHPAVHGAVVAQAEDAESGEKQLLAYVMLDEKQGLSIAGLRSFARERLPAYMVPAAFMVLHTFPVTTNGKIDRRHLPPFTASNVQDEVEEIVAPRTATEQDVASIWSEILRTEQIGVTQNFFDLGGHSLLAAQVISRVGTAFGVELRLQDLFLQPTIEGMARHLEEALVMNAADEDLDALLALLEQEDEQVGSLVSESAPSA
ncbi:hypothetical protein KDK_58830 [Dictyobacter kobayashii]|uniref:Carrier domain-containing protein n=1 Tax=Dictyobacter kobayashii TaxID=2014872 RepID=A0A402ASQ7_9CHLR|nr:hypothetical protein KDK_58830 [Dictyobacter kobayashii]